ncbi:amyloid-beta A4 precursor protein-binding family A member 3-like [Tiliqua scincoides]|uniref:amyloid-beta A4 precursor protein-binding family A member 3-like n=1 Tax=Tiliqua scincoides TaxID=71010 RepID=UPI003463358C
MDFKTDATVEAPREPLDPPPMDLEENREQEEEELPSETGKDIPSIPQQPSSPGSSLQAVPVPLNMTSGLCGPGAAKRQSGLDSTEGRKWFLDPQDSDPQRTTEERVVDSSSNMMGTAGDGADAAAQNLSGTWMRSPDTDLEVGSTPQLPLGINQGELLMELEGEDAPEADHIQLQGLLAQLQRLSPTFHDSSPTSEDGLLPASDGEEGLILDGDKSPLLQSAAQHQCQEDCAPCPLHIAMGHGLGAASHRLLQPTDEPRGQDNPSLLSAETDREAVLSLLSYERGTPAELDTPTPLARLDAVARTSCQVAPPQASAMAPVTLGFPEGPPDSASGGLERMERRGPCRWFQRQGDSQEDQASLDTSLEVNSWENPRGWMAPEPGSSHGDEPPGRPEIAKKTDLSSLPAYKEVPGPCEPEDLLDGVIFGAKYLGSTQLVSERNPPTSIRMAQAQEAVDRIKAPAGESQPMTEVDLFISTQRIKVLTADSQEAMMDHPLQTISYIADIGNIVVLMARRKLPRQVASSAEKQLYKMICHVFHSADAQLIAQAIGQAFSVAYQHFLRASGIDPSQLNPQQYNEGEDDDEALAKGEEQYNGDLAHFSKQENCKKVIIPKQKGEILGVVIVESGWGSILPTVVIANLMHRGAAERSGKLSIGDRIMSVNGTSLVGLPLSTCQSIIRDLKYQTEVTLNVVHCPPVTTAIVRRPDTKYPLGFCVENGIICSLMRGGIAERGGIRVGHRIIEINGQSVVAMPHEKIIQILTQAVSEVHIKTMPASTYRLLTGQEQPVFL